MGLFDKIKTGIKGKDKKEETKPNTDYPTEEQPPVWSPPNQQQGNPAFSQPAPPVETKEKKGFSIGGMFKSKEKKETAPVNPAGQQPMPFDNQPPQPMAPGQEEEKKENVALKKTKEIMSGTGKAIGGFFTKMKKDLTTVDKEKRFYDHRAEYWKDLGFKNGAPVGRETEFTMGSPAYINFCHAKGYDVDFPHPVAPGQVPVPVA